MNVSLIPRTVQPGSYYQGEIPWVKTREVDGGWILNTEEIIAEKAIKESNCKVFPERTVLVAMYGQGRTRGKVGRLAEPAATNQACAAICIEDAVDAGFCSTYCAIRMSNYVLWEEAETKTT
ncbi:hypothetical protein [Corynebacterium striatum]|uniref:hypothetical protein n=1 Tax=Corynebacterium striatum TaxID=43770 RepID=UPI0011783543|nr:hypothetical protein [Corynebacterium striatum]